MASFGHIELVTEARTHLWRDALFFLEQAYAEKSKVNTWYVGTYSRGSILFSVTAFESSCATLFNDKEFSNHKGHKGIMSGIKLMMGRLFAVSIDLDCEFWKSVQQTIANRRDFAHGKHDQNGLFIDYQEATNTAITLLEAVKKLCELANKPVEPWVDEYKSRFEKFRE
mgnify:CR=1 FL=1